MPKSVRALRLPRCSSASSPIHEPAISRCTMRGAAATQRESSGHKRAGYSQTTAALPLAHALALRVEKRLARERRGPALAENLEFEPARDGCERGRDVAERDRFSHAMPVTTRSDPAHDLVVMPHRLVADRVGAVRIDDERDEPPRRVRCAIAQNRVTAGEVRFGDVDKAIQPCFPWRIQWPIFARPVAEAL